MPVTRYTGRQMLRRKPGIHSSILYAGNQVYIVACCMPVTGYTGRQVVHRKPGVYIACCMPVTGYTGRQVVHRKPGIHYGILYVGNQVYRSTSGPPETW